MDKASGMLTASVVMFMLVGALWVFVGVLAVPLHKKGSEATIVFVSGRTDTAFFGKTPSEMMSDPAVSAFRTMMITIISGGLLGAGAFLMSLTWFGIRAGHRWALWTSAVGCLLAAALWLLALAPYPKAGVKLTLGDAPPFIWLPALLLLPATVLGYLGLR